MSLLCTLHYTQQTFGKFPQCVTPVDKHYLILHVSDDNIYVELVQVTPLSSSGRLLAHYETSSKNFLYPYPTWSVTYGTQDRDVLMERSLEFPVCYI